MNNKVDKNIVENVSGSLYTGVANIIDHAHQEVVVYVNQHANMMFWHIGQYINNDLGYKQYSSYGNKILATLSQRLTAHYGKGYTYSALTRMMKVAKYYSDKAMFATLSQTLTWSHFIELVTIEDDAKRLFYQQMGIAEHWSKEQPEGNYTHKVLCIRGADIPSINNCRHGFIPSGTTKKSSRDWALFFVYTITDNLPN